MEGTRPVGDQAGSCVEGSGALGTSLMVGVGGAGDEGVEHGLGPVVEDRMVAYRLAD